MTDILRLDRLLSYLAGAEEMNRESAERAAWLGEDPCFYQGKAEVLKEVVQVVHEVWRE